MAEKSRISALFLLGSVGLALCAPHAHSQGFEQLEKRLEEHPALAAMRLQSAALRETALAAVAWPDPVVSLGINNLPLLDLSFGRFLPTNKAIGVSQQIPNRAEREAKSNQAGFRAAQNDAAAAQQLARLRAELIVALIDKRRINRQDGLLRQQQALYGELADIVASEISAGRPALFRLAEVDLKRAEAERSLAELEGEKLAADARLVELVGEPGNADPPPLEPLAWGGDENDFHAVRVARAEIEMADSLVAGAQAAWSPDWGLRLSYQQRDRGGGPTPFRGDDWVSAAVTFTVPFWGRRSQAPALRAARAQREAARSRVAAAARAAIARYAALDAESRAAGEAAAALERQIAAIEEQLPALRTNYESGIGDYSPVIDAQLADLILRARVAGEQARRNRAVAWLNALMVSP